MSESRRSIDLEPLSNEIDPRNDRGGPEHALRAGADRQGPPSGSRATGLLNALAIIGFAIPALAYLWMIHTYGVNVIWLDQWSDVNVLGHAYAGNLQFSTLWSQHLENRILFPNLLVLALGYTTHLNVVTEEYVSASMLFVAAGLIVWSHKRRSPSRHLVAYCPIVFLLFSLAQASNALWGFQMAWYLVLLMLALAVFLLDRAADSRSLAFYGAIAAGVVGSFSSLQGLLIWPAGLVLMRMRKRPNRTLFVWILAATAVSIVCFQFRLLGGSISERGSIQTPWSRSKLLLPARGRHCRRLAAGDERNRLWRNSCAACARARVGDRASRLL